MATNKAEFFIGEMRDWKRTIASRMDEIYDLTNRLAQVIQRNSIPNIAGKVEIHQHKLDDVSEKFHRLQKMFNRQEKSLRTDSALVDDSQLKKETENFQNGLRRKIHEAEKKLVDSKNDCQDFLAGIYKK